MVPVVSTEATSIVFVGSFNPQIFQPSWFALEKLVGKGEAEAASIAVIHPDIAALKLGPFSLQVSVDRFIATTLEPQSYAPLRDLVLGTFRILRHTPVRMMGINRDLCFKADGSFAWEKLCAACAPTEFWTRVLPSAQAVGLDVRSNRAGGPRGYVQLRVEPSVPEKAGVYVRVNDHFEIGDSGSPLGCDAILSILESEFDASVERSMRLAVDLMEKGCQATS